MILTLSQLNDGVVQFATLSTAVSRPLNPRLDVMYLPDFFPEGWDTYEKRIRGTPAETELSGSLKHVGIGGYGMIPYGIDALAYKGARPAVTKPKPASDQALLAQKAADLVPSWTARRSRDHVLGSCLPNPICPTFAPPESETAPLGAVCR